MFGVGVRYCFKDNREVFWNFFDDFLILLNILFIGIVMGEGLNVLSS